MNLKSFYTLLALAASICLSAQLSGVYTVPGSYSTVASAVADLNAFGVSGPVTVNISTGHTEAVPAGGLTLTATGTATSPITFQRSGAGVNPVLSAYPGGTATPASAVQDGIWSLIGSDYITIIGIDLFDGNTTNNATMEYGYGLFKAGTADGCSNVTIRNCTVTLNRANNDPGSGPSTEGSRAINVVNAMIGSQTTSVAVSAPAGSHSSIRFYSNYLQNCNTGIALIGSDLSVPNADSGNDIGGAGAVTSNSIMNFGGGGSNPSMAIRTMGQQSLNIGYNRINNNTGSGVSHTGPLKGIMVDAAGGADVTVAGNIITLKYGGSNSTVTCIENLAGSGGGSNMIDISANQITQCTNSLTTGGPWYGIYNNGASAANLLIRNNIFSSNSTHATGGTTYLITNTGSVTAVMTFSGNALSHSFAGPFAVTGQMRGIWNYGGSSTATLNITGNSFNSFTFLSVAGTNALSFIQNWGSSAAAYITGNTFNNLNLNNTGSHALIGHSGSTGFVNSISNNSIITGYSRAGGSGNLTLISNAGVCGPSCTQTISGNYFANIVASGTTTGSFTGINSSGWSAVPNVYPRTHITNNVISNVTYSTSSLSNHYGYTINSLGDAGTGLPSTVSGNLFSGFTTCGDVIGFWLLSQGGPSVAPVISNNTVAAIASNTRTGWTGDSYIRGMYISAGPGGLWLHANRIYSLTARGSQSEVYGMLINNITTFTLSNNVVGNLYTPSGYGSSAVTGIKSAASSGTLHLIHNSIYIDGTSNNTNFNPTAFSCTSFEKLYMKNNIFINNAVPVGSGGQTAVRMEWGSMSGYDVSSDNNIFYAGTCGQCALMRGGSGTYYNIGQLKAAVYPREVNSHQENTSFASVQGSNPLFLHINVNTFSQSNNGGQAAPGYSTDIDNQVRAGYPGYLGSGFAPDIGADEYDINISNCSSALSPYVAPSATSVCEGNSVYMLSNISGMNGNRLFQWKMSSAASGPFTNAINGAGATNTTYISPPLSAGVYYFVLTNTCSTNSGTNSSNTASVLVMAGPSYTATASTATACSGQNIVLSATGSGATNFLWSGPPALVLSGNQNATLTNVGPGHSGTYTFNASAQCNTQRTVNVQVSPSVTPVSAVPVSTNICNGNSVTVSASGGYISQGYEIGTDTLVAPYTVFHSPYTVVYTGQRRQMIVLASELIAAGIAPGTSITSIQFPVSAMGQYWQMPALYNQGNQNFAVRIGTTSLSAFGQSQGFQTGLTTVVSPAGFRPRIGYTNYHMFSTPFYWNGTSNLVIETTFGNGSYMNYPEQGAVYQPYSNTADTMSIVYANNNLTAAQIAGWTTVGYYQKARPNFRLNALVPGTYSWTPLTALSSGTGSQVVASPAVSTNYTVAVSDNTCRSAAATLINVAQIPTVTAVASQTAVCRGLPVTLTASGAGSYQWINGPFGSNYVLGPLATAVYTVSGTNAPCPPSMATVQVVVYQPPALTVQSSTSAVCKGQTVVLTANGTGSFLWSTGATAPVITVTPQATTGYSVTLTGAQQCQTVSGAQVTVYNLPSVAVNPISPVVCEGDSINFTAFGAMSYTWMPMGVNAGSLTLYATQQFTVTGATVNGCTNIATGVITVDPCVGVAEANRARANVHVFPNPGSGVFTVRINGEAGRLHLIVTDAAGRNMADHEFTGPETTVSLDEAAKGVYFLFFTREGKPVATEKLIRQ